MSILVKHFVIEPKAVNKVLELNISDTEKQKLTETVVLLYHQKLLTTFLENLIESDRKLFLELLLSDSQAETINLLREKIADIEKIVASAILELEEQILQDLSS